MLNYENCWICIWLSAFHTQYPVSNQLDAGTSISNQLDGGAYSRLQRRVRLEMSSGGPCLICLYLYTMIQLSKHSHPHTPVVFCWEKIKLHNCKKKPAWQLPFFLNICMLHKFTYTERIKEFHSMNTTQSVTILYYAVQFHYISTIHYLPTGIETWEKKIIIIGRWCLMPTNDALV